MMLRELSVLQWPAACCGSAVMRRSVLVDHYGRNYRGRSER